MYGQRWKMMPVSARRSIAAEMVFSSNVALAAKYGVHERTIILWRKYAKSPNGFNEYVKKRSRIRPQSAVDADRDEDNKRDDRTLAIYRALRCDVGQTLSEIAKRTGYPRRTVSDDLRYLEKGNLARKDADGWRGVISGERSYATGSGIRILSAELFYGIPSGVRRAG